MLQPISPRIIRCSCSNSKYLDICRVDFHGRKFTHFGKIIYVTPAKITVSLLRSSILLSLASYMTPLGDS